MSAVDNLKSAVEDHCTLRINWTAPYTLQGVPINYYTINITRHSDGAVLLASDTTNTTDYFHSVIILGEKLDIAVAAVNGAGTGNESIVMESTPTSSELKLIKETSSVQIQVSLLTPIPLAIFKKIEVSGTDFIVKLIFKLTSSVYSVIAIVHILPHKTAV